MMQKVCSLLTRDDIPGSRGHERRRVHLVRLPVEVVDLHLPPAERPRLELELARLRNLANGDSRTLVRIL